MTPKMKATLDEEVREAARKLFLSSSVADLCKNEATPKQEEFLLHVFQAELAAREEKKRHRLMKRTGFPTYKTFEGYEYSHIQFPPLFESCQSLSSNLSPPRHLKRSEAKSRNLPSTKLPTVKEVYTAPPRCHSEV